MFRISIVNFVWYFHTKFCANNFTIISLKLMLILQFFNYYIASFTKMFPCFLYKYLVKKNYTIFFNFCKTFCDNFLEISFVQLQPFLLRHFRDGEGVKGPRGGFVGVKRHLYLYEDLLLTIGICLQTSMQFYTKESASEINREGWSILVICLSCLGIFRIYFNNPLVMQPTQLFVWTLLQIHITGGMGYSLYIWLTK